MLPKHYYKPFNTEFNARYVKTKQAKKVPSRMLVYLVMEGKTENDKVLEILIHMAETRTELLKKLKLTIENAKE